MHNREYRRIETYMLERMKDSAHDSQHVYRVLYNALRIAQTEQTVDLDILIASCLLHDVGREAQAQDSGLCHAQVGGEMAQSFLLSLGWESARALHVRSCVEAHRYRRESPPETIEAKILFDADKLEAAGFLGIARTLIYGGQIMEPLYALDGDDRILTAAIDTENTTFLQEFNYKLRRVYDRFYTGKAKELAEINRRKAMAFYDGLFKEITDTLEEGKSLLQQ